MYNNVLISQILHISLLLLLWLAVPTPRTALGLVLTAAEKEGY